MAATTIQWTDDSHNPIRARLRDAAHAGVTKGGYGSGVGHYCEKVSAGCAMCYSSTAQKRFGMPEFPGRKNGEPAVEVFLDEQRLIEPLSWKKPRRVFLCDMTDLFGPWVPDEWIDRVFAVMALTPHLTWQILTKRPERMAEYLSDYESAMRRWCDAAASLSPDVPQWLVREFFAEREEEFDDERIETVVWEQVDSNTDSGCTTLSNVHLGTSCENQATADERIPHLLRCPAAVRFISAEPLLAPINLNLRSSLFGNRGGPVSINGAVGTLPGIDWIIVGGESGHGARPCSMEWIRSIVSQCAAGGVPCFVKQLGADPFYDRYGPDHEGTAPRYYHPALRDGKGGEPSEWPADLRVREFPAARVPQEL